MNRRDFLRLGGSAALAFGVIGPRGMALEPDAEAVGAVPPGTLALRFLGTGAADWKGRDKRGEWRRFSSVLLDNRLLIDYTTSVATMLPDGCRPTEVFYTHSHGDHFDPIAALRLGIRRAYVGETWVARAKEAFAAAAAEHGGEVPDIVPLSVGEQKRSGDLCITALPANHATADLREQTLIYLVEKGPVRLLYATDTAGIPALAARIAGLEAYGGGLPITALVMEATASEDGDYRMFGHSSIAVVQRTVQVLLKTGRYIPADGQMVYLTHLARTLHGTQAELDATLPAPLRAAYDGLDVLFG
ncbi:MAG: hypothetical protein J5871_04585 [Bacteroidales bacterium]|nr:hypothetical protein [Bacteroidales bacterium]